MSTDVPDPGPDVLVVPSWVTHGPMPTQYSTPLEHRWVMPGMRLDGFAADPSEVFAPELLEADAGEQLHTPLPMSFDERNSLHQHGCPKVHGQHVEVDVAPIRIAAFGVPCRCIRQCTSTMTELFNQAVNLVHLVNAHRPSRERHLRFLERTLEGAAHDAGELSPEGASPPLVRAAENWFEEHRERSRTYNAVNRAMVVEQLVTVAEEFRHLPARRPPDSSELMLMSLLLGDFDGAPLLLADAEKLATPISRYVFMLFGQAHRDRLLRDGTIDRPLDPRHCLVVAHRGGAALGSPLHPLGDDLIAELAERFSYLEGSLLGPPQLAALNQWCGSSSNGRNAPRTSTFLLDEAPGTSEIDTLKVLLRDGMRPGDAVIAACQV